jgi:hypothetical protein
MYSKQYGPLTKKQVYAKTIASSKNSYQQNGKNALNGRLSCAFPTSTMLVPDFFQLCCCCC